MVPFHVSPRKNISPIYYFILFSFTAFKFISKIVVLVLKNEKQWNQVYEIASGKGSNNYWVLPPPSFNYWCCLSSWITYKIFGLPSKAYADFHIPKIKTNFSRILTTDICVQLILCKLNAGLKYIT